MIPTLVFACIHCSSAGSQSHEPQQGRRMRMLSGTSPLQFAPGDPAGSRRKQPASALTELPRLVPHWTTACVYAVHFFHPARADEPEPPMWPGRFHALLFQNRSGDLGVTDLWWVVDRWNDDAADPFMSSCIRRCSSRASSWESVVGVLVRDKTATGFGDVTERRKNPKLQ